MTEREDRLEDLRAAVREGERYRPVVKPVQEICGQIREKVIADLMASAPEEWGLHVARLQALKWLVSTMEQKVAAGEEAVTLVAQEQANTPTPPTR